MLSVRDLTTANGLCVSFEVPSGSCLALSGPSGSGKSLILRAIADLDPSGGQVSVDGARRGATPAPAWRRRVRYVAAEPAFWLPTLADAVGAPDDLLGLTPALLSDPVARLSTGQRQRGALLRALQGGPEVLLLDEPTSALDDAAAARVEAWLRRWLETGGHAVLVTHDGAQADRLADRHYTLKAPDDP